MPMLRKRFLLDEWVVISPERAARPRQFHLHSPSPDDQFCPFCPENHAVRPATISTYPSPAFPDHPFGVQVLPNKFPALRIEEGATPPFEALFQALDGVGAHEVVIESPLHHCRTAELPPEHLVSIFSAWQDRMRDLRQDRRFKQVLIFKNEGALAGATLEHVHSQIIALPIIAPAIRRELLGAHRFYEEHRRCPFCELIQREVEQDQRVVLQDPKALAIVPFASRVPFETWILPREHGADFCDASEDQLEAIATFAGRILHLWERALGRVSFNFALHSLPFDFADKTYYHWHLEMIPRTSQIAGFEWGAQMYINPTASEVAARHLKNLVT